ncbi:hypothetical protein NL459_27465, partial [Klebsiella pneumoniae]|nr:hypothetical protein [Klebsiella pneumoniae]
LPAKVASKDIYLGAVPFVMLQILLVVIVIFVPQTVTVFLDKTEAVDLDKVQMPEPEQLEEQTGAPSTDELFTTPPATETDPASAPR